MDNKVLSIKELLKEADSNKGIFKSNGIAQIAVTKDNVKNVLEVEIFPVYSHWLLKKFGELVPPPVPKIKAEYVHRNTGEYASAQGISVAEARTRKDFVLAQVLQTADPVFLKAEADYKINHQFIVLMIVTDSIDALYPHLKDSTNPEDFKNAIKDFEERFDKLGLTANQLSDLMKAIDELDSFRSGGNAE